jgi:hypothetical protein
MHLVDDDVHRLSQQSQILCHAHFRIWNSVRKKSKTRGVDEMIELAFESDVKSVHDVLCVTSSATAERSMMESF